MISLITITPEYIRSVMAERARRDAEGLAGAAKNLLGAVALSGVLVGGMAIADQFNPHRPAAETPHIAHGHFLRARI